MGWALLPTVIGAISFARPQRGDGPHPGTAKEELALRIC